MSCRKPERRVILFVSLLVASMLPPAKDAVASFIVSLDASLNAGYTSFFDPVNVGTNSNSFNSGMLSQTSVSFSDTQMKSGDKGSAQSDVDFLASIGALHGRIAGTSTVVDTVANTNSNTSGFGGLQWKDTYTVTSTTLAPGTPVDIVVRLRLDGSTSASGNFDPNGQNEIRAFLFNPGTLIELAQVSTTGAFSEIESRMFQVNVGQTFELTNILQMTGDTLAFHSSDPITGGTELLSTLDMNFSGTSDVALEVLTLGAGVQSESNVVLPTNFTQQIPEPATLALFGFGLAGLGFARRRKGA